MYEKTLLPRFMKLTLFTCFFMGITFVSLLYLDRPALAAQVEARPLIETTTSPVITATKTVQPAGTAAAGQTLTYTIIFTPAVAGTVVVSDPLPALVTYVSNTITGSGAVITPDARLGQTLVWTAATTAPNQPVTLSFAARLSGTAVTGALITNTAWLSGAGGAYGATSLLTINNSSLVYLPLVLKNFPLPPPDFANAGFEAGPGAGWTETSVNFDSLIVSAGALPGSVYPHSGNWVAWLGGRANEVSDLSQTVVIPDGYSSLTLTYWYWIASLDTCGRDFGYIQANNTTLFTHDLCSAQDTNGWRKQSVSVTAYQGQTVTFHFKAVLNGSLNSNFFIDDVDFEGTSAGASLAESATLENPGPRPAGDPAGAAAERD